MFRFHNVPPVGYPFRYNALMSAALGLFRLQQVDNRIAQTESRLNKIQETLDNDAELRAALQDLESAKQAQHSHEQERRIAESGAHELQIKIQQAESSLYGGKVHNPKELQDLQADVASLKKHLAAFEDQELDAMMKLESSQAAMQAAQDELARLQARLGTANSLLLGQKDTLSRELQDLQTERRAALSAIDSAVVSTYESLRQGHRGVAVAPIADNSCGGCGTTLTAALQQNARHAADLSYCPTCGRILFAS
jgi:uncharacterized protein